MIPVYLNVRVQEKKTSLRLMAVLSKLENYASVEVRLYLQLMCLSVWKILS